MAVIFPQGEFQSSSSTGSITHVLRGSSCNSTSTKSEQSSLSSEDDELAEINLLTIRISIHLLKLSVAEINNTLNPLRCRVHKEYKPSMHTDEKKNNHSDCFIIFFLKKTAKKQKNNIKTK